MKHFIIDFDSTFMQVEALDELGAIALAGRPDAEERLQQIKAITDMGMEGRLSFTESLEQRLQLLEARRSHLPALIETLKQKVSPSFARNRDFFAQEAAAVHIVSNGFREFIAPVVTEYGIRPENIHANSFEFDEEGRIVGFDRDNVLSRNGGKAVRLRDLQLEGDVYVIGDGYTDYEIKEAGLANKFYAFTENVARPQVVAQADHVAPTLDEFLYVQKLPMSLSYPKNRIRVLMVENIHPEAEALFRQEGYPVEYITGGLDEDELCEKIRDVSILCIRSKTQVTARVLEHANRLLAVCAFCIGTNQIDLDGCLRRGVVVFNAPYSNTRSVVELAIAEMIMLMRGIADKSTAMHAGKWNKSAKDSYEIRGKTLGIVGYGNIGAQLSVVAEAIGLKVIFYDIVDRLALGNAQRCASLHDLLRASDIVSLHVDGRPENSHLIGQAELAAMKPGVIFLNLARGHVVDIEALAAALRSAHVRGAAVDVFPEEPKTNQDPFESALSGLPNVLLSPHVGGSTLEAQINIAHFVPDKVVQYINTGNTYLSVNFPNIQLPLLQNAHRLIHIHDNVPGVLARINQTLSDHGTNIVGQYLKTNEVVGYVITDVDKAYGQELIGALKQIPNTIKFRVLF